MRAGFGFLARLAMVALLAMCAALPLTLSADAADAPKRRALVIGIDGYADPDLAIPGNSTGEDAIEVAKVLDTVARYDTVVTVPRNATKKAFAKALAEFSKSIGDGDLVVIFYSGHGVEFDGDNYFLLADAEVPLPADEIETKSELQTTAVSQRGLLQDLRGRHPGNVVLIINACRDSIGPAATLGGGDGAIDIPAPSNRVEADPGTMVIYATSSGKPARVCLDRDCKTDQSPMTVFTRRLVQTLATPNLAAKDLVNTVGREVENDVDQSIGETQRVSFDDQISFKLKDTLYLGPVQVASVESDKLDPGAVEPPKPEADTTDEAKGDLGIKVTPRDTPAVTTVRSFAEQLGMTVGEDADGVSVQSVADSSVAAEKGFAAGDRIIEVNNQHVASIVDFDASIASLMANGRVAALLKTMRGNTTRFIGLPIEGLVMPAAPEGHCLPDGSALKTFLDQFGDCTGGPAAAAEPGYLGLNIQDVTQDIADSLGLDHAGGTLVTKPVTGSPGELAGLKSGDVIQGVDGVDVPDAKAFQTVIGAKGAGATVQLQVFRDGKVRTITATLGARPQQTS